MTVDMPILAYSSQEDKDTTEVVEIGGNGGGAYKIQVQDNNNNPISSQSAMSTGNVTDFVRMQQQSTTPIPRVESPDKIFDPKPPNYTGASTKQQ